MKGYAEKRDVDVANAFTTRLKALLDYKAKVMEPVDPEEVNELISSTIKEETDTNLGSIMSANHEEVGDDIGGPGGTAPALGSPGDKPPLPGARKGSDGGWYLKNFAGNKGYSRVM